MQSIGHEPFAVEPPDADLDEVLEAHDVIMASLQHLLEEVQEELPATYVARGDRDRVFCG
ncbi:MAG TPA: hypothetical protein VKV57_08045 [bacterium]|nr:hypothetical protein [bacterium]